MNQTGSNAIAVLQNFEPGARGGGEIMPDFRERIITNPFYILGLRPDNTKAEIEERARWLIDRLAVHPGPEETYATPLGRFPLTRGLVDDALKELGQPTRRLSHEIWAHLEPGLEETPPAALPGQDLKPFDWSRLRLLVGW